MKDVIKGRMQADVPYEKVMQDQLFRNAIDACRKARSENPGEYPNYVCAFKTILLPKERKVIEEYLTNYKPYAEELIQIENEVKTIDDKKIQNRIRIYRKRDLSFYLYTKEIEQQYNDGMLEDINFDTNVDKQDVAVMTYTGLEERIIDVLVDGGWISTGRMFEVGHD